MATIDQNGIVTAHSKGG
ncbi:hypothetical protein LDL77_10795 [Flagellimonas marinaquae]|nr:hypothetical protein LDL77_10795 [Allomuricauda aquimarina]